MEDKEFHESGIKECKRIGSTCLLAIIICSLAAYSFQNVRQVFEACIVITGLSIMVGCFSIQSIREHKKEIKKLEETQEIFGEID